MSWHLVGKEIALLCIRAASQALANEIEQRIPNTPKKSQNNQSTPKSSKVINLFRAKIGGK